MFQGSWGGVRSVFEFLMLFGGPSTDHSLGFGFRNWTFLEEACPVLASIKGSGANPLPNVF